MSKKLERILKWGKKEYCHHRISGIKYIVVAIIIGYVIDDVVDDVVDGVVDDVLDDVLDGVFGVK